MKLQDQILTILTDNPDLSSSEVYNKQESGNSYSTTKRTLAKYLFPGKIKQFEKVKGRIVKEVLNY